MSARIHATVALIALGLLAYIAVVAWTVTSVNRWDDECQAKFGPAARHISPTECEVTYRQEHHR